LTLAGNDDDDEDRDDEGDESELEDSAEMNEVNEESDEIIHQRKEKRDMVLKELDTLVIGFEKLKDR
jgi:hypothetical protein